MNVSFIVEAVNRLHVFVCRALFAPCWVGAMLFFFLLQSMTMQASSGDTLRIAFVGDLLLDRGVRKIVERRGVDALFHSTVDSVFRSCHIVVANLECPATTIEQPLHKQFTFRAEPEWLHALRRHYITHLNMANNHTMDQSRRGLVDTWKNIKKARMIPLGMGYNAHEACRPHLLARTPRPVYLLSSQFVGSENWSYLPDEPSLCECRVQPLIERIEQIKQSTPNAYVIVQLHWGAEHRLKPEMIQRVQARQLIDGGADCVLGHHTHTAQSIENYKGKPIYYSLGNFIFDQHKLINSKALLLRLDVTSNGCSDYVLPLQIKRCRPEIVSR